MDDHAPRAFPRGALAPCELLWEPRGAPSADAASGGDDGAEVDEAAPSRLWLWAPAAAYDDVRAALAAAAGDAVAVGAPAGGGLVRIEVNPSPPRSRSCC